MATAYSRREAMRRRRRAAAAKRDAKRQGRVNPSAGDLSGTVGRRGRGSRRGVNPRAGALGGGRPSTFRPRGSRGVSPKRGDLSGRAPKRKKRGGKVVSPKRGKLSGSAPRRMGSGTEGVQTRAGDLSGRGAPRMRKKGGKRPPKGGGWTSLAAKFEKLRDRLRRGGNVSYNQYAGAAGGSTKKTARKYKQDKAAGRGRGAGRSPGSRGGRGKGKGRGSSDSTAEEKLDYDTIEPRYITAQNIAPLDVNPLWAAARNAVSTQEKLADDNRKASMEDLERFKDWISKEQQKAQETLQERHGVSRAEAEEASTAAEQSLLSMVEAASKAMGGNSDLMDSAGITSAMERAAALDAGSAGEKLANATSQQAATDRMDVERQANQKQYDEILERINTTYQNEKAFAALQRNAVEGQAAGAQYGASAAAEAANAAERRHVRDVNREEYRYAQDFNFRSKQAAREAKAEAAMQKFLNDYKLAELGVQQQDANTRRINAQSTRIKTRAEAKMAKLRLQLDRQVQQGKMTNAARDRKLRQQIARMNVTQKEKDRITRIALAGGSGSGGTKAAQKELRSWFNTTVPNAYGEEFGRLGGSDKLQVAHQAIDVLSTFPNLTPSQALAMLRANVGPNIANDASVRRALNAAFRSKSARKPGDQWGGVSRFFK